MSDSTIKDWLSAELQKVHSVVIYINPAVSGVMAPQSLKSKPSFTLQLSHHFDRPLIFREDDIKSDFLFDNGFESCIIPLRAIWAAHPEAHSDQIVFWNQNSPGEGWDKALQDYLKQTESPPSLRVVESSARSASSELSASKANAPSDKSRPSRSHLKLVK